MSRFFALALFATALLPASANAGAREDVRRLEVRDLDSRHAFVGWTEEGQVVARRFVCSEDGELTCTATMDRASIDRRQSNTLAVFQDFDAHPSRTEAAAYVEAEREAAAALPELLRGAPIDARTALGSIDGEPIRLDLRTVPHPAEPDSVRFQLVARGPEKTTVVLRTLGEAAHELRSWNLLGAMGSPEGSDVAFAVHYADSYACWDGEDIELVVASRDRVRAQVLNKLGLRRYRSGDLYAASELFRQATREDEDYAWGWYNSAALHSVHDEQNEALISLRTALELDPSKAERACDDPDFEGLRDTDRGAELLACE